MGEARNALMPGVTEMMTQMMALMAQMVGCIQGLAEACHALDCPVVSGNVSLYNETNGQAIPPTPAIGAVGVIDDIGTMATIAFKAAGETILLIGHTDGHIGASLWLRELGGLEAGPPPPVDLAAERAHGDLVRDLILDGAVTACHDVSDGGLLVAVAEMALAGGFGADIALPAARRLIARTTLRGHLPEPIRLAHLIAGGVVSGESQGRA